MVELDQYSVVLSGLRSRVKNLAADARTVGYSDLLGMLDDLVKESRRAAKRLEESGQRLRALAFYELIVEAYRTARKLAPRRERAALSEMADFWESMLEGKRVAAMRVKRVERQAHFATAPELPDSAMRSQTAYLVQPSAQRKRQARATWQTQARVAQRNSFLRKPK